MKAEGYKGIFVTHPSHFCQSKDFVGNEIIEVLHEAADYHELFNKCSLIITDYSSVAMDFAYEKKPVIYTQFDKENFFETQIYTEGYFNYETDGFGNICSNYNDSVSNIIQAIKNGCVMEEKYKQRVDKFFQYNDMNNCDRVYQEILKL